MERLEPSPLKTGAKIISDPDQQDQELKDLREELAAAKEQTQARRLKSHPSRLKSTKWRFATRNALQHSDDESQKTSGHS